MRAKRRRSRSLGRKSEPAEDDQCSCANRPCDGMDIGGYQNHQGGSGKESDIIRYGLQGECGRQLRPIHEAAPTSR